MNNSYNFSFLIDNHGRKPEQHIAFEKRDSTLEPSLNRGEISDINPSESKCTRLNVNFLNEFD